MADVYSAGVVINAHTPSMRKGSTEETSGSLEQPTVEWELEQQLEGALVRAAALSDGDTAAVVDAWLTL